MSLSRVLRSALQKAAGSALWASMCNCQSMMGARQSMAAASKAAQHAQPDHSGALCYSNKLRAAGPSNRAKALLSVDWLGKK